MNLPVDYIAVHIRRGDKIVSREMKELGLFLYIDAVKGKKHISRNVFIATDDGSVTDKLKSVLVAEGFNVYWNTAVTQTGFDESLFNTKDKKSRYIDTLNMLLEYGYSDPFFIFYRYLYFECQPDCASVCRI